jgi:hypothetical protein
MSPEEIDPGIPYMESCNLDIRLGQQCGNIKFEFPRFKSKKYIPPYLKNFKGHEDPKNPRRDK